MASFTIPQRPGNELHRETTELSADDIERLGRKRPEMFGTTVAELGFCFSLLASMVMAERCPFNESSDYACLC